MTQNWTPGIGNVWNLVVGGKDVLLAPKAVISTLHHSLVVGQFNGRQGNRQLFHSTWNPELDSVAGFGGQVGVQAP